MKNTTAVAFLLVATALANPHSHHKRHQRDGDGYYGGSPTVTAGSNDYSNQGSWDQWSDPQNGANDGWSATNNRQTWSNGAYSCSTSSRPTVSASAFLSSRTSSVSTSTAWSSHWSSMSTSTVWSSHWSSTSTSSVSSSHTSSVAASPVLSGTTSSRSWLSSSSTWLASSTTPRSSSTTSSVTASAVLSGTTSSSARVSSSTSSVSSRTTSSSARSSSSTTSGSSSTTSSSSRSSSLTTSVTSSSSLSTVGIPLATSVVSSSTTSSTARPSSSTSSSSTGSTTTTSSSASQTTGPGGVSINVVLQQHNFHRQNTSTAGVDPNIAWNATLANAAAQLAATCNFGHNTAYGGGGYGQNIAGGTPASQIAVVITDEWYNNEINYFDGLYGQNSPNLTYFDNWGHYTQVVWAGSTTVGCAVQYCANGWVNLGSDIPPYFTVCNYYPAGNVLGEFATNVFPPGNAATINI